MALDATVAGPAANSYLTVAEADALAANDPIAGAEWIGAPLDKREQVLAAATADVDTYRRSTVPFDDAQALLFPRDVDVVDPDADPLEPLIHRHVKRATYEQATHLLRNAHLIAQAGSIRARGVLSQSDDAGGFTLAVNPTFGLYAPRMTELLDRLGAAPRSGRMIMSVPIASSFGS